MDTTHKIESQQTRIRELLTDAQTEAEQLPEGLNLNQTISELQETIEALNRIDSQTEQD
ncbi:hypothetical protein [Haloterrigena salina]|uniref:hypothetical protein n=1 Tax=Haloterrigena salina TaxID=504937 RepID=UPI000A973511|nr:hypothetical protein [Haloterrigena salina]